MLVQNTAVTQPLGKASLTMGQGKKSTPVHKTGVQKKSDRRGSNPRPAAWEAAALPTELLSHSAIPHPAGRGDATLFLFKDHHNNEAHVHFIVRPVIFFILDGQRTLPLTVAGRYQQYSNLPFSLSTVTFALGDSSTRPTTRASTLNSFAMSIMPRAVCSSV